MEDDDAAHGVLDLKVFDDTKIISLVLQIPVLMTSQCGSLLPIAYYGIIHEHF